MVNYDAADVPSNSNPCVMMFPYLRIPAPICIGPWQLEPATRQQLEMHDDEMAPVILSIMDHLLSPDGDKIRRTTLVTRSGELAEPVDPDEREAERIALQVAVSFCIASANADDNHVIDWDVGPIATAEVGTTLIVLVPDGGNSFVAPIRGGPIANITVGGHRLGSGSFIQRPPEGLINIPDLGIDEVLADATYRVEITTRTADNPCRIHTSVSAALHWYSRSWENSSQRTMADVLVHLKTALEALSRKSDSWQGSAKLETMYRASDGCLGADANLWRHDAPHFSRDHAGQQQDVSAFKHWYLHLADLRNSIVHDTLQPEMEYTQPESPFHGNVFRVAERVTRELITIRIAQLGYPAAALTPTHRIVFERLSVPSSDNQTGSPIVRANCTCDAADQGSRPTP